MYVCTLLKANPMGERVRSRALKGKINFTHNHLSGFTLCPEAGIRNEQKKGK